MFGNGTVNNDDMLFNIHKKIYENVYSEYNTIVKKMLGDAWELHFTRNINNSEIKTSLESFNIQCDYLQENTDKGHKTQSKTDGGIILIGNHESKILIPITWVEGKSSFSVSKGKSRGQASGLIAEQHSRILSWTTIVNNQIFPLVAFCYGTDYNQILGEYNIRRIREDLHTIGNCNPYEKGYFHSAWFYYKEKFDEKDVEEKISEAFKINFEKLMDTLSKEKEKCIIMKLFK